jgi:rsbT co-antagonist protein RsbR
MTTTHMAATDVFRLHGDELARLWQESLIESGAVGDIRNRGNELKSQAGEFIQLLSDATLNENAADLTSDSWKPVKGFLTQLSESRARQGYTSSQTAMFVFSLK